jgi:TATA-box binding protein (TBP) (component of TFIID and TFIIIB)
MTTSCVTATPYRISTMTATGSVGTIVNLHNFYDCIEAIKHDDPNEGVIYAEYGNNKHSQVCKGVNTKKKFIRVNGKKEISMKRFDNSVTLKIKFNERNAVINVKLFKNGKVQMTGVKSIEQGKHAVETVVDMILKFQDSKKKIKDITEGLTQTVNILDIGDTISSDENIVENVNLVKSQDFKIHLINSDFKVNFEIRRDLLYKVFLKEFDVICTYEPCIYPGVKVQYFLNKDQKEITDIRKQGVCCCSPVCDGKGDGFTTTKCKKITISVFQSGCILITGVTMVQHINLAYSFIVELLKINESQIKRIKLELP